MDYRYAIVIAAILLIGIAIGYLSALVTSAGGGVRVETITVSVELQRKTVIDAFGRLITFDSVPSRVVSLAPSITEKLFALGLEEVVVGVDSYSNYPEKVTELINEGRIAVVGGPWTPDLEKIIALKPELVILCRGIRPQESLYPKLEEIGIKTVFLLCDNAKSVYDIYSDLHIVGAIFNVEEKARLISNTIERGIDEVVLKLKEANASRRKVLILIGPPSWGIYSAGGDTFIGWLIDVSGGVNVAGIYSGWPQLNYEFILDSNPDVIIITAHDIDAKELYRELLNTPIAETAAWINKRVYLLTDVANDLLSRPGPRIVEALEMLAHIIHPEIFGEVQRVDVHRVVET